MNTKHYQFTYELNDDFQAFPTMAVVVAHGNIMDKINNPGMPKFNPMSLLHGEESLEIFSPIEPDTTIVV